MSRVVHIHIGAPKTGTTYVQDRLSINAAGLARHGVHYPGHLVGDASTFHFRAALDLLGQDWGGPAGHADGAWRQMVRKVRRRPGNVIISHEILAPAPPEAVARAMRDLRGAEVHVVYSARDLGRQLPAAWQESIKQGRKWSFNRFLNQIEQGNPWFGRAFDLPQVLETWGAELPPEQIHVVTVPRHNTAEPDLLWHRFCEALRIDPEWAPKDSTQSNASLGIVETQLLRKLNRRMGRQVRRDQQFDELVLELLARDKLAGRRTQKVRLPHDRYDWAETQTKRWVDWLTESGVDVIGDVAELSPRRPPPGVTWVDPDRIKTRPLMRASLDALEVMTREAASRPESLRRKAKRKLGRSAE